MKITTGLAASICIVTLASCGLGKARQSVSQIDRGMTKSQIVGILGQPRNKNVQENNREVWEYLFQDQLSEATLAVNVTFEDRRDSKYDCILPHPLYPTTRHHSGAVSYTPRVLPRSWLQRSVRAGG